MAQSGEKPMSRAVRERRATPAFSAEPVAEQDLRRIVRAGLEAPSSYNLQPWRFVIVCDAMQRARLRAAADGQEQVEQAPVVIVACADPSGWRADLEEVLRVGVERGLIDAQRAARKRRRVTRELEHHPNIDMWVTKQAMIAATTMMWMAEALGYDTGPMEGFSEVAVRSVLGIPDHLRVIFLLAIGRLAGEDGAHPGRLPASHTVFGERYGQRFTLAESARTGAHA